MGQAFCFEDHCDIDLITSSSLKGVF